MRKKIHPYIQKSRTHWDWDCGYDEYKDSDKEQNSLKRRERLSGREFDSRHLHQKHTVSMMLSRHAGFSVVDKCLAGVLLMGVYWFRQVLSIEVENRQALTLNRAT